MSKRSLYIVGCVNFLCCFLLLIFQLPNFVEAADFATVSKRRQYILEAMKMITYAGGAFVYLLLGCHSHCPDAIRHNFHLKFSTISFLLSVVVTYDGIEREFYHYIAYGLINLCTTALMIKEILREREAEYRLYLGDDYEKVEKGEKKEEKEKIESI